VPILAAVPAGDARDLLELAGHASLCGPSDVGAMAAAVLAHVERGERGEPTPSPRAGVLRRYERKALSRQLASLFDEVLGARAGGDVPAGARADRSS
jgi:hypothetical protein